MIDIIKAAREREPKIGQFYYFPIGIVEKIQAEVDSRRARNKKEVVMWALEAYFKKNGEK